MYMVEERAPRRINEKKIIYWHLVSDVLAIVLAHVFFVNNYKLNYHEIYRLVLPQEALPFAPPLFLFVMVLVWMGVFYLAGNYYNVARRSGMQLLGPTLVSVFFITLLLFFGLVSVSELGIGDIHLEMSVRYFIIVFGSVFALKMILVWVHQYKLHKGKIGYLGILIGNQEKALEIIKNYHESKNKSSFRYIGYVAEDMDKGNDLSGFVPCLGTLSEISQIVKENSFDEALIVLENASHHEVNSAINELRSKPCLIKLLTDLDHIIEGTLKTANIEFLPYISISRNQMPVYQRALKTTIDYVFAWGGMIFLSPVFVLLALGVRLSSPGPVFYKQERIGKDKKPFKMYKFRSMYIDAEENGPALSSNNDPRITPFGRYLRKWHLDELPQLYNVILGDMSLVGPRPERKYFVDQLVARVPHYAQQFLVKPGITSWGMVKYGYAENIEQMIERLKYDTMYLENRTLVVDLKIMLYTVKSIICGDGK